MAKRHYNVSVEFSATEDKSKVYELVRRKCAIDWAKKQSLLADVYETWVYGFNEKNDEVLRLWFQDGECVGEYIGDLEHDDDWMMQEKKPARRVKIDVPTYEEAVASFEAYKQAIKAHQDHDTADYRPENYNELSKEEKDKIWDEWWNEDKALEAKIDEARKALIPYKGRECTICYYSDYRAAKVTKVISRTKIAVSTVKTTCKDWYAGDYEIDNTQYDGLVVDEIYTKRKNGLWVKEGHETRDGVIIALHYQRHYIDPSF